MNDLAKVTDFFHQISPKVLDLVSSENLNLEITTHKSEDKTNMNFATELDIKVEEMITSKILEIFPQDKILAEERYAETEVEKKGRFWIIDPICGTGNLARGIKNIVTNIALLDEGELVASVAIDHSCGEYIWSVGSSELFINKEKFTPSKRSSGTLVEVDLTALVDATDDIKARHAKFVSRLIAETNFYLTTLASSLSFSYVALGKIDAIVSPINHLWDAAASVFLIRQAGGVVTDLEGRQWTYKSNNLVGSLDRDLHAKLIDFLE